MHSRWLIISRENYTAKVVSWFVLNKPLTGSKNSASTNCKYLQNWSQPSTDGTGIGASMSTSKSVCCSFAALSFLLCMLDTCGWMKLDSFGLSFSDSSYISVIIYISFVLLDISPLHRELIQTKSEDKKSVICNRYITAPVNCTCLPFNTQQGVLLGQFGVSLKSTGTMLSNSNRCN